ncbi:MAG TPA: four helix bundle protein [Candidatus Binatia bacterium]|nr:four helix bundle protein [Candidatus Binatia bacterium]
MAKARELTKVVYQLSGRGYFAKDFGLRGQIREASVSIMANIAEGFERDGTGEFIQFLAIAKGSAAEVLSHSYVALDQGFIRQSDLDSLADKISRVSRMIAALMIYLRKSRTRGLKFKTV